MSNIITLNAEHPAMKTLCKRDKRLAKVVRMVGTITYKPYEDSYAFLVSQIIGQMLSNKVADVLCQRLTSLCDSSVTPAAVEQFSDDEIKSIGISANKVRYIRALTEAVREGQLEFDAFSDMDDAAVIRSLTAIHGIGQWSAKMYLIFVLNRQDVLPYEDAAFLQGYGWAYKTDDFSKESIEKKCRKWKPYSSLAARYMYRALDMGLTKSAFHLFKEN